MVTVLPFSALSPAAQLLAVRQLRRDIVRRLGHSGASLAWWRRAVLAADPVLEWSAGRGTAIVRRGQTLLDQMARCYLVTRSPVPDFIDEELLALLP